MALGRPFPGSEIAVVDERLCFLPAEEPGELALAGRQLASGYFAAPEATASRFRVLEVNAGI